MVDFGCPPTAIAAGEAVAVENREAQQGMDTTLTGIPRGQAPQETRQTVH
jgi:hypothetical protein